MTKKENVKFLRLLNGDDIIVTVSKKTALKYSVLYPMHVMNDLKIDSGMLTVVIYPWIPVGVALTKGIDIRRDTVLLELDVETDIKEYYLGMILKYFEKKPLLLEHDAGKKVEVVVEGEVAGNILKFEKRDIKRSNVS